MVKVHCLISCFCEVIKRYTHVDYRPYYFGVWDADFVKKEDGVLTYYTDNHEPIINGFEHLFSANVQEWYDSNKDKESNLQTFLELLDSRNEHQFVLVQIDMSLIPERDNKFALKPFPHFLMISKTENEDEWFMFDPDFRWEGNVKKATVIEAFLQNPFGGGYLFDARNIVAPSYEKTEQYFHATFQRSHNEFTSSLKALISDMAEERNGYTLDMLLPAVKQVKVIAIRKYSYEYAFMFFKDYLQYSRDEFLRLAYQIEDVVQAFTTAQYLAVKMSMTKNLALLPPIIEALEEADTIELQIKEELESQFIQWTLMDRAAVTLNEEEWR